jgi:diguanylate cyclase (GGDEF)-like protein/PAS domain S-box-containing protein
MLHNGRALVALPLFGLLLIATIWSAALAQLASAQRAVLDGALKDTQSVVAAYEQFVRRAIRDADRTALLVKREFERHGTLNLEELVEAGLVDVNKLVRVRVIDAAGNVVGESSPRNLRINVADREYFIQHREADSGKLEISKPVVGRSTGRTFVLFTRRMNHRDGSFAGVVAVTVTPDYFTEFYDESDLGKHGSLGVVGLDGSYRARRVGNESASAREMVNAALLSKVAARPVGSYEGVSPADHITRLFAYRKLDDYPLVITAAKEKSEVLAEFRRSSSSTVAIASLATLAIVIFFSVLTALAVRLERQGADLVERKRFLRTLVDNVPNGVAVRTVRDGKVGPYVLWNRANEALSGVMADAALGKTVAEVLPPEAATVIEDLDRQLLAKPSVQQDIATVDLPGRGRRIIRRIRTPILSADNEVEYVLATLDDITEEQARMDELRLASKVFETTADGIILTDAEDRVISVNTAFSKLTGFDPNEMLGKRLSDTPFRPIDLDESAACRERLGGGNVVSGEVPRQHKDGTPLSLWVKATGVRDQAGSIVNYIRVYTDISQLKESQRKLEQLASFDALTGLPNRHLLYDRLVQALRRTSRYGGRMALMFIDLDGFKEVNDTLGHDVGDALLKQVGTRLRDCVRESDSVCRFGGDEFVVLLEPVLDAADAKPIAERIMRALAPPFIVGSHRIKTGASIGIAINPQDGIDATTLLKNADVAMYKAKKTGRNRFAFFSVEPEGAAALVA